MAVPLPSAGGRGLVLRQQGRDDAAHAAAQGPFDDNRVARLDCGEDNRLERCGIGRMRPAQVCRQRVVELFHMGAAAIDAANARIDDGGRKPRMQGGRLGAQLQHVAQDRDAARGAGDLNSKYWRQYFVKI